MTSPVSNLIIYTSTRPRRRQRKLSKFANLVESVRQANRTSAVQDWRKVRLSLFIHIIYPYPWICLRTWWVTTPSPAKKIRRKCCCLFTAQTRDITATRPDKMPDSNSCELPGGTIFNMT